MERLRVKAADDPRTLADNVGQSETFQSSFDQHEQENVNCALSESILRN